MWGRQWLTHHVTDGEPGAVREMSSVKMSVAGALLGCSEGELGCGLLRHEHLMLRKEETPVSLELLLWARHCPCPYCRLAHALTAGWHPFLSLLPECQLRETMLP